MKKRYLFLMTLFVQLIMCGGAFAADPPKAEYDAAMAAITEGNYYITTEVDGVKYYLTVDGELTDWEENRGTFIITKVSGGALYDVGIKIDGANGHFSNTTLENDKAVLNPGTGVFRLDTSNDRGDWERQVFYMNEEGKFAIRSCNVAFGESSWNDAGRAFWTYQVENVGTEEDPQYQPVYSDFGLMPAYTYEPAYIWSLELPPMGEQVYTAINALFIKYEDQAWDDEDCTYESMNMGTNYGQCADWDSWRKFWKLLQEVNEICDRMLKDGYVYEEDPEAPTLEQIALYQAQADSLYQVILDSEVPYVMPEEGYYRIIAHNRYKSTFDESGFVDKAIAASFDVLHENKVVFGTLSRDRANYVWKLTKSESGDSILMQNLGMETYISLTSKSVGTLMTTADASEASYVMFDYAYDQAQEVEPDGNFALKDIFCIRLAQEPRKGNYFHQNGHASVTDDSSPWGNYGVDSGTEQEMGFWMRTWDYVDGNGNPRTSDLNTSEWFLEFVPEDEAAELKENFEAIFNHDVLVQQNNELREKVAQTLALAKDVIKTKQVTSVDQISSPYSDPSEGTNIGNLIDNDATTFWHTDWHGVSPAGMYYDLDGVEIETHYVQFEGMDNLVGDCELYLREREGADNDRVKTLVLMGTDNLKNDDFDWEEIALITLPHTGKGEENTVPFTVDTSYPYWRLLVIDTDYSSYAFRKFWHAAEIQFYTIQENPNSQFNQLGEVAENLENTYNENMATADENITLEIYEALLKAYETFLSSGLIDPAELRAALNTYAKATAGVAEGNGPGLWSNTQIADDFLALYAEADAYNKAGKYDATQIHKYAVMLKAMQKSIMEQANGVKTDKWYRIMYPTEDMFDMYGFGKEGGDKTGLREDQSNLWGTFATVGKEISEEEVDINDEGEEVTTTVNYLEFEVMEDFRESTRTYFMTDEEIQEPELSEFRFVEIEADPSDYTPLFQDVKDNMLMALDMSTTYTKGDALITDAAQFSSNASYPGNDGQKLESGCLIDNNFATYWHSDYSKQICEVPYLQVALNAPVSGMIQVYVGRRNASNGHVVRMYVQGSNDAQNWTSIGYIETPFVDVNTPSTSQPIDLGGSYSYLRFTMTNRYGTDGGSNVEFDPFAEGLTADDYNTKFTYFHASEFQIYPVTPDKALSTTGKALQQAYTVANKVILKDATAEDLAAAAQAYKAYRTDFNSSVGKTVLPNGMDKAPSSYAIQNKATGLFINAKGGNTNDVYLLTVPTLFTYNAIGYQRSLLHGTNLDGTDCTNLHAGESNRRLCTWSSAEPTSNSGLIICETDEEYAAPESFTFYRDINVGKINAWCSSVTLTPADDSGVAFAYSPVGLYTTVEGTFLALEAIDAIPAGEPAFYIYGDTASYDSETEPEVVPFRIPGNEEPVLEGKEVNGLIGSLVNHTLLPHEIYFSGNHPVCIGQTGYYLAGPCAALDIDDCPEVDANGNYDFSIFLGPAAEDAVVGVKDISSAIDKISQPGNVYSMDGKLLRTGATLNSLKSLGTGMYILNGVKVVVK